MKTGMNELWQEALSGSLKGLRDNVTLVEVFRIGWDFQIRVVIPNIFFWIKESVEAVSVFQPRLSYLSDI